VSQFRVIFGLPRAGDVLQDFALKAELDLALGQLGQERTPASLADEFVDAGDDIKG
jgi:hypothetical protein